MALITSGVLQDTKLQEGVKGEVVIRADYDPFEWKKDAIKYTPR